MSNEIKQENSLADVLFGEQNLLKALPLLLLPSILVLMTATILTFVLQKDF